MTVRYFPKPQPLSPNTKTWVDSGGVRWQKDKRARGGRREVKGTWCTDSIYYLWFEYLKRSKNYKKACGYEVEMTKEEQKAYKKWRAFKGTKTSKSTEKILSDFGDIHAYEGVDGFWKWWTERGQYLFGIEPINQLESFASVADVNSIADKIEDGTFKLVAIPTNIKMGTIKRRLNKLLKEMTVTPTNEQTAAYFIEQPKIDVKSLRSCLLAYDLSEQGMDALEIGIQVRNIDAAEADDLIEDGRSRSRQYDVDRLIKESVRKTKKYRATLAKVLKKQNKLQKAENDFWDKIEDEQVELDKPKKRTRWELLNDKGGFDTRFGYDRVGHRTRVDYLSEEAVEEAMLKEGYIKTHTERTRKKQSIRTNTYKLLTKARENIEATEGGMFGVGHETKPKR